jgi:hypothetical protein
MFGREPVLVIEVVKAAIAFAIAVGLDLAAGVEVAIIGLTVAVLSFAQRSSVTPWSPSPLTGAPTEGTRIIQR